MLLAEVQALLPSFEERDRGRLHQHLFYVYVRAGNIAKATALGPVNDTQSGHGIFISGIAQAQAAAGLFAEARATAQTLEIVAVPSMLDAHIAIEEIRQGQPAPAFATYDLIDNDDQRVRMLLAMAAALTDL